MLTPSSSLDLMPHPPRSFNTVQVASDIVIKTSQSPSIRGEIFFYQNIPCYIRHLFPNLHWYICRNNQVSFAIDRIQGPTLSHLLINNQLEAVHLQQHLDSLYTIHRIHHVTRNHSHSIVYNNYYQKVCLRYSQYHCLYSKLGMTFSNHFSSLQRQLQLYQSQKRALSVSVIHGDPVFTNIILSNNTLKYIDMRGSQGSTLTLSGDAVYDLAKTYQSLCGYDLIIANVKQPLAAVPMLTTLHGHFIHLVNTLYPSVSMHDLLLVTCSHFTSLIPLHHNAQHQQAFAAISRLLLNLLENGNTNSVVHHLPSLLSWQ